MAAREASSAPSEATAEASRLFRRAKQALHDNDLGRAAELADAAAALLRSVQLEQSALCPPPALRSRHGA